LNIRSGPGTENIITGVVRHADRLIVTAGPRMVGEVPWYEIRNIDLGTVGWVHGGYLTLDPANLMRQVP
jgi:hypothetical protein